MQFPFSFCKTATGGATPPAWGGEVAARFYELSSAATSSITTNATVSVGERIVIVLSTYLGTGQTIGTITDTHGNTYAVDKTLNFNTNKNIFVISAYAATQITSGDIITVNWTTPASSYRWAVVGKISNAASGAVDATASNTAISASPSATASTVAANTVCVGVLHRVSQSYTYSGGAWTAIGVAYDPGASGERCDYFYTTLSAAGSQNPAGSLSGSENWGVAWVSYQ